MTFNFLQVSMNQNKRSMFVRLESRVNITSINDSGMFIWHVPTDKTTACKEEGESKYNPTEAELVQRLVQVWWEIRGAMEWVVGAMWWCDVVGCLPCK